MKNNATCTIRSEKITIDVRICAALAANRGGDVYLAAIAPDMELTVITLDEAPGILPCFEEDDACLNLPDTSLLLCYNPAQVLKMGGKHYLTGPVILVRTNMDGEVISLTIDEVYLFQKYERIARAIRENNARLVIIDPVQAFLGADVDMNRANEVRPIYRSLGDIAQATGCAIVLIGHLNKAAGTQSTYRGLGSIDITAAVRSLLFIGKLKDSPTTRVLIHEKSSLAPPGQSLAFSLGDEKGFEWIGAYDITADELLAGTDSGKTESKTAQAQMLILELLADGKRMPSAELEKAVNERGISSRTMRTAKSRIGDRLVTEKDSTAWVCYLRD